MRRRLSPASQWVEKTRPARRINVMLLLIALPDQGGYIVADMDEIRAIADPNSFDGRLLRHRAAFLKLNSLSEN